MSLKVVKETGLQASYEELITELADLEQLPDDPFEYAAAFFLNSEKKKQSQLRKIQASYKAEPVLEAQEEGDEFEAKKKPRRVEKITLRSRANAPAPLPKVTPSMFEITQQKPRPLITSYKKEKISYGYVDVVSKQEVVIEATTAPQNEGEYKISEPSGQQPEETYEEPAEGAEARFQSNEAPAVAEDERIAEAIDDEPLPPQ